MTQTLWLLASLGDIIEYRCLFEIKTTYVKKKVVPVHVRKAYKGRTDKALLILNVGIRLR